MALPLAITVGCGKSEIVDYTIDNAEYQALVEAAAPAAEERIASSEETKPAAAATPSSPEIVLASAPPKIPTPAEPVLAAALPPEPLMEKEPAMAAKPASVMAAELAAAEAKASADASAALEATAALEAKVAQLEALTIERQPAISEEPPLAAAIDINRLGFTPSIYATAGLGVSRLNPDTSAAEGFTPNDLTEPAGQVGIGVDVARFLSLEAHSADYGSTSLSPEGRVNYHVNGVSALFYAGRNRDRFRRRGLNAYARLGFNRIETSPIGDIPFLERSSNHASFGLGAEYVTRIGLGLRADLVAYDSDVQYGQLGLLYRMGSKPSILPKLAAATPAPAPKPTALPEFKAAAPKAAMSKAAMPVIETDPLMDVAKQPAMKAKDFALPQSTKDFAGGDECIALNGILSNVTFRNGSAELTHGASIALDNVANTLFDCTDRQIVVSAHTDSNGSAAANDRLSKRRARAVAVHLANRGIDTNRIRAVSFGESRPVASNATQEGRTRNRRVELEVR